MRHRHVVLERVVVELGVGVREGHHVGERRHQERAAVGRRGLDRRDWRSMPAGAGLVLDHDRPAQRDAHLVGDQPGDGVDAGARRKADARCAAAGPRRARRRRRRGRLPATVRRSICNMAILPKWRKARGCPRNCHFEAKLTSRRGRRRFRAMADTHQFRARVRRADRLHAPHARLLPRAGLRQSLSLGALCRCAVHAAQEAAEGQHAGADHHGGALPARQGRPGAGRALQRRRQVLHGLFGRHARSITTRASATSATTASTPRPRTATPGFRCR